METELFRRTVYCVCLVSDSLGGQQSWHRFSVKVIFSAPVQTGPGSHRGSYTMGTGSLPGVKRLGRGVNHPHPSSAEVNETVQLYLYSHSVSSWQVIG
jgi:hypothetical protein